MLKIPYTFIFFQTGSQSYHLLTSLGRTNEIVRMVLATYLAIWFQVFSFICILVVFSGTLQLTLVIILAILVL